MTSFREVLATRRARLPTGTTCFRWSDEDLPGVTVDLFADVAVLSLYRDAPDEQSIAEALAAVPGIRAVYVKRRPREARKVANESPDVLAPPSPLLGAAVDALVVEEQGAKFEIRPGNGLSVGLYLDARDARRWVRENAAGRTVLNTFSYTCGFGVAARLGGAKRAVNLDASRKVLDWGEKNLALNGFEADRYDFISGDTFEWLGRLAKKHETFELVVLDPPGFATTKSSRFSAHRDYHQLAAAAEKVLAPKGLLLAMCNVEQLGLRDFTQQVQRGFGRRKFRQLDAFGASEVDFRQPSTLKCLVFES